MFPTDWSVNVVISGGQVEVIVFEVKFASTSCTFIVSTLLTELHPKVSVIVKLIGNTPIELKWCIGLTEEDVVPSPKSQLYSREIPFEESTNTTSSFLHILSSLISKSISG